jgi:hypothetical protein
LGGIAYGMDELHAGSTGAYIAESNIAWTEKPE